MQVLQDTKKSAHLVRKENIFGAAGIWAES